MLLVVLMDVYPRSRHVELEDVLMPRCTCALALFPWRLFLTGVRVPGS